jgi:preprotein translocase subunit SecF
MASDSLFRRLYRGESNVDFIGSRKKWYTASAIIIAVCILAIVLRGFVFSIDFVGGDKYQFPVKPGTSISQINDALAGTDANVSSVQTSGNSTTHSYIVQTEIPTDRSKVQAEVYAALEKAGKVGQSEINLSSISGTWGSTITDQAIWALVWFLIAVSAFISIRFRDWRMAVAAVLALFHDLILTAGVYALVGFTVSPSTVVGLLTILGFSLYDTVVVFDKVDENSRGILAASRYTYGESANMAVNQTLMRSINTSLIGLLPVAGLLFVGAGILGVGTLEDLALVLFVGMLTGAYSSLFLATPWLVDLKMLDPRYKNHAERVKSRRDGAALKAAEAASTRAAETDDDQDDDEPVREGAYATSVAPRVGAKPATRSSATPAKRPGARPASGPTNSAGGKRRA